MEIPQRGITGLSEHGPWVQIAEAFSTDALSCPSGHTTLGWSSHTTVSPLCWGSATATLRTHRWKTHLSPSPSLGGQKKSQVPVWMHLLRWDSDAWAASEMCLSEVGTTGVKERGAGALLHGVSLHQHPQTGPGVVLKADSLAGVRQTNLTHSGEVLLSSAQGAPWTFHRSSTPGSSGVFLLHTNNRI